MSGIIFDYVKVFDEQIREKMDEVMKLCRIYSIPFFYTACVKEDETGTEYFSDALTQKSAEVNVTNDQIAEHIKIVRGYKAVKTMSTTLKSAENKMSEYSMLCEIMEGVREDDAFNGDNQNRPESIQEVVCKSDVEDGMLFPLYREQ